MLPTVYLASQSPRRRVLLEQIGMRFRVLSIPVDETREAGESAEDFVRRMAVVKATAGWHSLPNPARRPVIGADTVVVLDGDILGKPQDARDARRQLAALSGRTHEVLSAVALVAPFPAVRLNASRVWFRDITAAECEQYCATEEPLDKAGSYAIQGRAAVFISRLEGSYSGVMGLPLFETASLLSEADIDVLSQ